MNTLLVAVLGIVLATVLGFTVGICRLSKNWLLSRVATGYVELIRNIPLLLQLLFWYNAVLKALPELRDSAVLWGGSYLNNRGLFMPQPMPKSGFGAVEIALLIGVVVSIAFRFWARRRQEATGQRAPVLWVAGAGHRPAVDHFRARRLPAGFCLSEKGRFNIRGGMELLRNLPRYWSAGGLHRRLHRRGGSGRHSLGLAWPERSGASLGLDWSDAAAHRHSAGDARDYSAADQPVSEPHQELVTGRFVGYPDLTRCSPARC